MGALKCREGFRLWSVGCFVCDGFCCLDGGSDPVIDVVPSGFGNLRDLSSRCCFCPYSLVDGALTHAFLRFRSRSFKLKALNIQKKPLKS